MENFGTPACLGGGTFDARRNLYIFITFMSPPEKVIPLISEQFPKVLFIHEYYNFTGRRNGISRYGKIVTKNGDIHQEIYGFRKVQLKEKGRGMDFIPTIIEECDAVKNETIVIDNFNLYKKKIH